MKKIRIPEKWTDNNIEDIAAILTSLENILPRPIGVKILEGTEDFLRGETSKKKFFEELILLKNKAQFVLEEKELSYDDLQVRCEGNKRYLVLVLENYYLEYGAFVEVKKTKKRRSLMNSVGLIGSGNYCPDCGGLCGNEKHTRRW